jgi:hypothetical protein
VKLGPRTPRSHVWEMRGMREEGSGTERKLVWGQECQMGPEGPQFSRATEVQKIGWVGIRRDVCGSEN